MRKLLLLISLFVTTVMMAGPVDQEAAKQKAMAFASVKMGKAQKSLRAASSGVRHASNRAAEREYLHVFNIDGGGYVIVSGDDRTEEILGYSLTGTFDANKIPDNMRGFLQEYVDGIQYLDDHNIKVEKAAYSSNRATKASIAPLVKTQWDQWAPYNIYCPQINDNERGLTGCGATALAQVINYWQHPKTTPTIPGYKSARLNIDIEALDPITIDWDHMQDTYTCYNDKSKTVENASTEEKAVGMLMRICGQALEMDYGTASMGGSSAYTSGPYKALVKYLDYEEATLQFVQRVDYSYSEWQELIYNELANKRPVLYTGQSAGGGHLFVCDGYDKDDFFHINWGWSGSSDTYFRLNLLNPYSQGAGGSSTNEGFGVSQDATIGIQPNDVTVTKDVNLSLYNLELQNNTKTRTAATEDFSLSELVKYFLINSGNGGLYSFDVGVRIVNSSNTTVLEEKLYDMELENNYYTSWNYMSEFGKNQPDGIYKLYLLSRETGTTTWKICKGMEDAPILLTISGNTLTVTIPESKMAEVKDLELTPTVEGELIKESELTINVTVKNNNASKPFRANMYYDVNGDNNFIPAGFLEVEGGKTTTFSFNYTPQANGTYKIRLQFQELNVICETPIEFVVGEPTPEAKLEVTGFDTNIKKDGETYYVEGDEFQASVTVKNTGDEAYTGNFLIYYYCHVIEEDKWYYMTDEPDKKPLLLFSGKETTIKASLTNPHWDECDLYCLGFGYTTDGDDEYFGETKDFEFRTGSGINMIKVVPKDMTGKIYDLQGRRIDAANIESVKPGMYIINGKKVVIKKR